MSIKTLHLTNYWHARSGGIATFYRHLIETANRLQRCAILVVPGERDEVEESGAYCRIYKIAASRSLLNRDYRTIYPREFLLPDSKLQHILATERPDLVEICDKYSLVHLGPLLRLQLMRRLNLRPVVVGLTCERMDENINAYVTRSSRGRSFSRLYMRHVYFPAFDHHIAVSENTAAELRTVANGHIVPRGTWIRPMGVDDASFSPVKRSPELRRRLLGSDDRDGTLLLLYVGRLAPEKNLGLLIAMLAELERAGQPFRLIFAGDGIARESLRRDAQARFADKVVFLGHISDREELARLYASCDFFVHPNPAEPFGIAPLEAMASGLPVVAPNRGGITSYANEGCAYLADPTPEAFARAILMALRFDVETACRAKAARAVAEAFAWPKVTERYLDLYDALYRVGTGCQPMEAASPAFVSSIPAAARAARLHCASRFVQAIFAVYVQAHRVVNLLNPCSRNQHQTELKGAQSQ